MGEEGKAQLYNRRVIMAPMAGINTPAFCEILKQEGCDFIYTGLLTSHGLIHQNRKTKYTLETLTGGVTLVGQIFGAVPDIMAASAAVLEATGAFAAIDINMGCPVPKVIKSNAGAGLMREPKLAGEIVRAVRASIKIPVSVKIRSGWNDSEINYLEMGKIIEDSGADAIALHARTRAQGYRGEADWSHIAALKESLSIPVIASGDVTSPEGAVRCMNETGCDSVMIGRAAVGNPTLIFRAQQAVNGEDVSPPPDFRKRLEIARMHATLHCAGLPELKAIREMRGPMAKYVSGLPSASVFRNEVNKTESLQALNELIDAYAVTVEKYYNERQERENEYEEALKEEIELE